MNASTRDPLAALARVGLRSVPELDPGFADRLDARLREVHALPGHDRPPHRAAWAAVAGAVAVALALVVAIVADSEQDTLTIAAANAASVVLPDGTVVPAAAGLELPDGALVLTGPGGSAVAGGVRVPALATAVVVDDRLVLVDDDRGARPATPTTASTTTTAVGPSTTILSSTTAPSRPPPRGSTTSTPPTPTTRADTTTTAGPPARLDLDVEPADAGVVLRWTRYEGSDFGRYVVYRVESDQSTVVHEFADAGTTTARDRPGDPTVGYQVVVLDGSGRVIASSPVANLR